ncbi:MAG TPA: FAD-binding protein [Novosphingobium sp.]|nr:FAD-binding protein [Novosphingobium sp.]
MDQVLITDSTPTGTPVGEALRVSSPEDVQWDATCDLLVVGIGLAGASATLRGSELGLDTIAVDRFIGGGSSELSGGVVYAGATHVQAELGIEDSVENLYNYISYETGELFSQPTLRKFSEDSPGLITWLEGYGVPFGGPVAVRKASYPPKGHFLYYSGNENSPEGKTRATPAPRGHRALPTFKSKERFSGVYIMTQLKQAIAAAANIKRMYHSAARRLVVDGEGRVVGAEIWQIPPGSLAARLHAVAYLAGRSPTLVALNLNGPQWAVASWLERRFAKPRLVRARKGVVLSAGGFVHNKTMTDRFAPLYTNMFRLGQQGDDGSGIRLGVSAGAITSSMSTISAWRFVSPPYDWPKGIFVSSEGKRFTNEELYGARTSRAMYEKAGGKAWLIVDQPLIDSAKADIASGEMQDFQLMAAKTWLRGAKKAKTVAGLEQVLGMPAGSLQAEVDAYNTAIATSAPDAQGKSDEMRSPLLTAPFYGLDISHRALAPLSGLTMGGLSLDEATGAARRPDGSAIPGLYAAGRNATGMCSNEYISGLSLADCIWSGHRAAQSAAAS